MKKFISKQVTVLILGSVLPLILLATAETYKFFLEKSDFSKSFFTYSMLAVIFLSNLFLLFDDFKNIKKNQQLKKILPVIFAVASFLLVVYSSIVMVSLYGFRHGVGF